MVSLASFWIDTGTIGAIVFANKTIFAETTFNTNINTDIWMKITSSRTGSSAIGVEFISACTTFCRFNTFAIFRTDETCFTKTTSNALLGTEFQCLWKKQIATTWWTCGATLVILFIDGTFSCHCRIRIII